MIPFRDLQGKRGRKGFAVLVYLKLSLTAVFWGGTFIAGRVVTKDMGPFSAAFLRFAIASGLLLWLGVRAEGRLPSVNKKQLFHLVLLGMTGIFAYNVFFFSGLKRIEAGRAAILIANNPIVVALLASYFFGERLGPFRLVGIALSVTGAVVVISKGDLGQLLGGRLGRGELYISFCVLSWALYSLIGKVVMRDLSPLVSVAYSSVIGALALFIPACTEGMVGRLSQYSVAGWTSVFYLGIFGTVLGSVWYYEGIQQIGPTRASQFSNFVPITGVILAYLLLREPLTLSLAVGALLVVSGVTMANKGTRPVLN